MNQAVFLYTFLRLAQPATIIKLALFVLAVPTVILVPLQRSADVNIDLEPICTFLSSASMTMIVAFMFMSNSLGNTKSLDDGEYLALLFSRPLTRSSYIFSKWLAGSLLVFAIVCLQIFYFVLLLFMMGRGSQFIFSWTDLANAFLNSFGASALVVMIYAFPARVGLSIFFALVYLSFAAPFMLDLVPVRALLHSSSMHNILSGFCDLLRGFVYSPIDLDAYFNAMKISWLPILSFLSNIAIYLSIAITVINRREFFYANE